MPSTKKSEKSPSAADLRLRTQVEDFIAREMESGRLYPYERDPLREEYLQAVSDDLQMPLADGSREERIRSRQKARKAHGFFEEKLSNAELFLLPVNDNDGRHPPEVANSQQAPRMTLVENDRGTGCTNCERFIPRNRGLTVPKAALLLHELFPNVRHAAANAKGEFLGFLTGLSADTLRKNVSPSNLDYSPENVSAVDHWRKKLGL